MKIDDKTYELIIPEFPKFNSIGSNRLIITNDDENEGFPFALEIWWAKTQKGSQINSGVYDTEGGVHFSKTTYIDHEVTEADYNAVIQELQQAYAKWVFETLFKEVEQ